MDVSGVQGLSHHTASPGLLHGSACIAQIDTSKASDSLSRARPRTPWRLRLGLGWLLLWTALVMVLQLAFAGS
jgi:hypothetical protein